MANMKYVYHLPGLVDSEDDAVGLEDKLPEILFKVLSFPRERTALGKSLQRVYLIVESLKHRAALSGARS